MRSNVAMLRRVVKRDLPIELLFDTAGNVWNPAGAVTAAAKDAILDVKSGGTTDVPGVGAGMKSCSTRATAITCTSARFPGDGPA